MITDRISLNLIYVHLKRFKANQGEINNIQIAVYDHESDFVKTIHFSSVENLKEFIDRFAPAVHFNDIECFPLKMFELKSFNTIVEYENSNSNKNYIINNSRVFETTTKNIYTANLDIFNKSYVGLFLEVWEQWLKFKLNEYILIQRNYIDCGYIQTFFESELIKLRELYRKNK
jgi:hypothetical protein